MKIDLKKDFKELYQPGSADFTEVDVPPRHYLGVDGHGDPNTSPDYAAAVAALYAAGYAIKFVLRARTGDDFVVGPLEGLWTSDDPTSFTARRKGEWCWTMLIPLPDVVSAENAATGLTVAAGKKPELPIGSVQRILLDEGRCLQVMHRGSFDDEGPVLDRLHHEVMPARGLTFNGPHHEIYLSDPRRVAPERMRTVLRQPVRSVV